MYLIDCTGVGVVLYIIDMLVFLLFFLKKKVDSFNLFGVKQIEFPEWS